MRAEVAGESYTATILATDAVGYSRAMSRDEALALRALAASKAIITTAIRQFDGRVFATAGDSVLAEFAAPGNAVNAAVTMQRLLAEAARHVSVLSYRVGIHMGPVHPDGTDLLGDTVNIAARLESLAYAGGICISGQVHQVASGTLDLDLVELGPQLLKNILEPVRVLRIRVGEAEEIEAAAPRASLVAVLTFVSQGPGVEPYLAEGLADDLVVGLSRFQNLAVLSRASTASDTDPMRLAAALGVAYVVRGSLRVAVGRLRIAVEVVDARTGRTIWAERFDGAAEEILEIQDEVIQRLVATIVGRIEEATTVTSRRKRPESAAAFDLLLQGVHHANRLDSKSNLLAIELLETAVARDPGYALAWAWLALMRLRRWAWTPVQMDLGPVRETAQRALVLDPSESWCHLVAGQVAMYGSALEIAEVHHKKAYSLNPYDCHIMALRAPLATYLGKPEEGADWALRAMSLYPGHPSWYATNLGLAQYCARNYAEAERAYLSVAEPQLGVLAGLAAARAQLGDAKGAESAAQAALRLQPDFSSRVFVGMRPFRRAEDGTHLLEGLTRAGLPE
ncbi:MAG: hypothetical protein DI533_11605 [Cereibacter sphaeroides]|uniref:Guanylate cyclase domain-containing protein n=1 Tax=Cereibacter sphaeroides TaxID=1063 RepID=A0A2W5S472_CERSP|nr:MAG: hypothetical protein DI533_11605 [Cereibacter sphaeroides]